MIEAFFEVLGDKVFASDNHRSNRSPESFAETNADRITRRYDFSNRDLKKTREIWIFTDFLWGYF